MEHYELLYIIPGHYTEEEGESVIDKVNSLVKKCEGEITFTDNLGSTRFAYPIRGIQSGNYIIIEFNAEPSKIKELDSALKLTSEILRFQIVRKRIKTQAEIEKEKAKQVKLSAGQEKEKIAPPPKVSLEELDKKLGEILGGDII